MFDKLLNTVADSSVGQQALQVVGAVVAGVQARALREAADEFGAGVGPFLDQTQAVHVESRVKDFLRARADRLEKGEQE